MARKFRVLLCIAALFLISSIVYAEQYYADVVISVDNSGTAEITGLTNHPGLQGTFQNYTSKIGDIWTLNITLDGNFSDFVYEIRLPPNSAITYIKVPGKLSIENLGYLSITGSGKNSELSLIVQYQIKPGQQIGSYLIIVSAIVIVILAALIMIFYPRKKPTQPETAYRPVNKNLLTEREKQIVEILEKNPLGITQARLQKETNLPKASLSRNLMALERKGMISKSEKGMTNYISLKKS